MQVDAVLKALIEHAPMSGRALSSMLGKSPNWAGVSSQPGRSPELATVADVADVAGCDVCIIDRETGAVVATVTPPRKAQEG